MVATHSFSPTSGPGLGSLTSTMVLCRTKAKAAHTTLVRLASLSPPFTKSASVPRTSLHSSSKKGAQTLHDGIPVSHQHGGGGGGVGRPQAFVIRGALTEEGQDIVGQISETPSRGITAAGLDGAEELSRNANRTSSGCRWRSRARPPWCRSTTHDQKAREQRRHA